jgi:hypothetical protein
MLQVSGNFSNHRINIVIRKLSACLLCELVWNNDQGQARLGEVCDDITPVGGAVAINMEIPRRFAAPSRGTGLQDGLQSSLRLLQIFEALGDPTFLAQQTHKSGKYWCYPPPSAQTTGREEDYCLNALDPYLAHFPDPKEHLIGFICYQSSFEDSAQAKML